MPTETPFARAIREGAVAGARYRLCLPRESLRGGAGMRLGQAVGASVDFRDFRDYQPGDDLRHLDWGVYARSDRRVVRLFREEVTPHLDLILDVSRSMDLPDTPKSHAAVALVALLATAAANGRCTFRLWLSDRGFSPLPAVRTPSQWPAWSFEARHSPAEALARGAPRCRRNSLRIFVSDLLWPEAPRQLATSLASQGAALTIVQLLADREASPTPQGERRLQDVESDEDLDLWLDEAACQAYRELLTRHQDGWAAACRATGARLAVVTAEAFADTGRLPELERLGLLA